MSRTGARRSGAVVDALCAVAAAGALLYLVAGRSGVFRPALARPVVGVERTAGGRDLAKVDGGVWQKAFQAAGLPAPPKLSGLDPVPVGKIADAVVAWGRRRDVASLVLLGQLYAGLGQMEASLPVFAAAAALEPRVATHHYLLGLAAQRLQRNDEAVAALTEARRLEPDYPWTALRLGLLHLERNDTATAIPLFEDLRQREPSCPWGRIGLGRAALQKGEFPVAKGLLQEAKRLSPRDYYVRLYLTRALAGAGDHAAARREEDFLRRLGPYDPLRTFDPREEEMQRVAESHRYLERLYLEAQGRGQPEAALQALRAALARRGDDPLLHLSTASMLRELGRLDEAASEVEAAARLAPTSGAVARARGELAFQRNDPEAARKHLAEARRLDPSDALPYDLDGRILFGAGKREEAAASFRRALELDPKLEPARVALAVTELQLGRRDVAKAIAGEILELNPGSQEARQVLAAVSAGPAR